MASRKWYDEGLRFQCSQCGDCCTGAPGYVWVNQEEIEQLAAQLQFADVEEFEDKYGYPTPLGVKGRNSDNRLYRKHIGWEPSQPLIEGMKKTYEWIKTQVKENE